MTKRSVLVLTTYPIVKPRHGGQVRSAALVNAYRKGGFSVSHFAVVESGAYPRDALGALDLEFPANDPRWFIGQKNIPMCSDLRSGIFAAGDDATYKRIRKTIPGRIDVFHLEQPWLYPLVKRLKLEPQYSDAVVVYGSQNIEAPLREAIFRQLGVSDGSLAIDAILSVETEATRAADVSLAVAPVDHDALHAFGAKAVVRAQNGIDAWATDEQSMRKWQARLNTRRFALFVGSAHPPNFDGFFRAFGDSLGFVPPDCKIVVAGSVSSHIFEHYHRTAFNNLNLSRLEITGELESQDLAALKNLATVFLLPIFEGGGSNIKTAEAIYSGKPLIATSASLRGYDEYAHLPQITIANARAEFIAALRSTLLPTVPLKMAAPGADIRSNLLWRNTLSSVPQTVLNILSER